MTETPCPICGTPVMAGARFCGECAAPVTAEQGAVTTMDAAALAELKLIDPHAALLVEAAGGDYHIEGRIGEGAMGAVYLAREVALDRMVAIKIMIGGSDQRFSRESVTTAKLAHPHIIPIYAARNYTSPTGKELEFFVMKFIEGDSVDHLLRKAGKMAIGNVKTLLIQVAQALQFAHENGVIHRDIKPANIMIDKQGFACVADFGIAKAAELGTLTQAGTAPGTPAYMSPEQLHGEPNSASDQYALGVVAFELISGNRPFDAQSIPELITKHLKTVPPLLTEVEPGCPPELARIVARMLEKKADDRFASMEDVVTALRKVKVEEDDEAVTQLLTWVNEASTTVSPLLPAGMTTTGPAPEPPTFESGDSVMGKSQAPRKRTRSRAVVMAVGVLALGGGLGWAQWSGTLNLLPGSSSGPDSTVTSTSTDGPDSTVIAQLPPERPDSTPTEPGPTEPQPDPEPDPPQRSTPAPPRPGRIIVTDLPPDARILVNGLPTPDPDFEIDPGRHEIRLEADGFVADEMTITVGAGDVRSIAFTARPVATTPDPAPVEPEPEPVVPDSATLDVVVNNPGGEVLVNNVSVNGRRQFVTRVEAGRPICVSIRAPNAVPLDTLLTLVAGETRELRLILPPGSAPPVRTGC